MEKRGAQIGPVLPGRLIEELEMTGLIEDVIDAVRVCAAVWVDLCVNVEGVHVSYEGGLWKTRDD